MQISFDAPSADWSAKLTGPTVSLCLYDVRADVERTDATLDDHRVAGRAHQTTPPLRLELTYAVSAWAADVADEHRLLSQVLVILHCRRSLQADPGDRGDGALGETQTWVGRPREGKAELWSSLGAPHKASIDYVVRLTVAPGARIERGPDVGSVLVRARRNDLAAGTVEELESIAGTVRDADGRPVAGAQVLLAESAGHAETGPDGRFRIARVERGSHRLEVRAADGAELAARVTAPGAPVELVVGAPKRARKARED